ncbi:hypothetical protein ACFXD5_16825 [Streptomyces sp. NPDC059385]|uniref:hypothetical protein n=1 Tax=Streptomyces sp. NPDC059385 TaxID=3346817 RepID=UPI0036AE3609
MFEDDLGALERNDVQQRLEGLALLVDVVVSTRSRSFIPPRRVLVRCSVFSYRSRKAIRAGASVVRASGYSRRCFG